MLAGLPYVVWPIGSLFILGSRKKEDPFLHYHAVQALLTGAVLAAFSFVLILFFSLAFRVAPGTASYGGGLFGLGFVLGGLGVAFTVFLTAVFLGWRATEGEMIRIPFLGDIAENKMLDQTGMTRRQFTEMCERAMEPMPEEEIPFPEVDETAHEEPAIDRLEAARAARAAKARRDQAMSIPSAPPSGNLEAARQARADEARRAQEERLRRAQEEQMRRAQVAQQARETQTFPPAQPRPPAHQQQQHQPRPVKGWPQGAPPKPSPGPVSKPKVTEVDLIGHYKEKKVGPGQNKEVLKQWLSSVDTE